MVKLVVGLVSCYSSKLNKKLFDQDLLTLDRFERVLGMFAFIPSVSDFQTHIDLVHGGFHNPLL